VCAVCALFLPGMPIRDLAPNVYIGAGDTDTLYLERIKIPDYQTILLFFCSVIFFHRTDFLQLKGINHGFQACERIFCLALLSIPNH
jgi:hypothetical protein